MTEAQKARCKYLTPLGFSKRAQCHRKARSDTQFLSPSFLSFQKLHPVPASHIVNAISFKEVGFSRARMELQENKMDVPCVVPDNSDPYYNLAVEFTWKMFQHCLEVPLTPVYSLVKDASPGFPYQHLGITTKGQAVVSDIHYRLMSETPDPVALSVPKGCEALPVEDLNDGKLRTIFLTPAYFVGYQKFYFDSQNIRMKLYHDTTWCKYGYVKQYGGFNRLMRSLERFFWLFDFDISGYDRRISLHKTYELRTRGLRNYAQHCPPMQAHLDDPVYKWVVFNCTNPVVAFGNGTIWRRLTGNNSGSNDTTTDNTIAHTIIIFHLLVRRMYELTGLLPSYENCLEVAGFMLFGDDDAGGLTKFMFDSSEQLISYFIDHFALYGLVIKPKSFHIVPHEPGTPYSGISFLGSTCSYEDGIYVPYPRVGKLMYSISSLMRSESSDPSITIDKIVAIWDLLSLCTAHSLSDIKLSVSAYALFVYHDTVSILSQSKRDQLVNCISQRANWSLLLGYELRCPAVFPYFPPGLVVGGIKATARMDSSLDIPAINLPLGKAPRRIRNLLNSMLAGKTLTPGGLKWLIVATDPFHDDPINCDGFFDLTTSSVITQTLNFTSQIIPGSTVPSGTAWDCHIFFLPCSPPLSFVPPGTGLGATDPGFYLNGILPNGVAVVQPTSPSLFSGFNCLTCSSGQNWITSPGSATGFPTVALPQSYCSGYFRVIAAGFEVVNTTAELYKGGTVTVYKSPAYPAPLTISSATGTATQFCTLSNCPPSTQSQAALFPCSRTWGASDGAYMVEALNSATVPFISNLPTSQAGVVIGQDVTSLTTGSGSRLAFLPTAVNNTAGYTGAMNSPLPFDISGAVFTGLNYNSTLQITVRYIIERIPSTTEPDLLVLSRNPCPEDPMAVELYTRVMASLPVGVKVSDNPDGEWFLSVLEAIAAAAPTLGMALAPLTGPLGPAIGTLVGGASGVASTAIRSRKQKQSQAPQNNKQKK